MKQEELEIINFLQKCKGERTWMRGKTKSTIDYVLIDKNTTNNIIDMEMNEKADKWGIGADQSWIQITMDLIGLTEHWKEDYKNSGTYLTKRTGTYM